ncbi:hypothetical protein RJT34_29021 [Clitoria ternatea]|uniref:Uncharacterized protein n=1 Tax=Clitoria ternatea TaxID=43366 RepID=A0AAN9F9N7_CLITE
MLEQRPNNKNEKKRRKEAEKRSVLSHVLNMKTCYNVKPIPDPLIFGDFTLRFLSSFKMVTQFNPPYCDSPFRMAEPAHNVASNSETTIEDLEVAIGIDIGRNRTEEAEIESE